MVVVVVVVVEVVVVVVMVVVVVVVVVVVQASVTAQLLPGPSSKVDSLGPWQRKSIS